MSPLLILNIKNICYFCEKLLCYAIVFAVTPGYFIFEMAVVRPQIIEMFNKGPAEHIMHVLLSTFCFVNIAGNMIMTVMTDTSRKCKGGNCVFMTVDPIKDRCRTYASNEARGQKEETEHCKKHRQSSQLQKTWHCQTCNACILKRDHHCFFFSRCIGLHNQRYYILFLFHTAIAMLYSGYYNYYYVASKNAFENHGFFLSIFRVIFPMGVTVSPQLSIKDLYVFFLVSNYGQLLWSIGLFQFHIMNVIKGVTAYESRKCKIKGDKSMWKENLLRVFGKNWRMAIICPFVDSQ